MCNFLHNDFEEMKRKQGVGYKLFRKADRKGELTNLMSCSQANILQESYYITKGSTLFWDDGLVLTPLKEKAGFCFFPAKKEAMKALRYLKTVFPPETLVCHKISYKKALGQHLEKEMLRIFSVKIALCKEFTVLEEVPGENAKH